MTKKLYKYFFCLQSNIFIVLVPNWPRRSAIRRIFYWANLLHSFAIFVPWSKIDFYVFNLPMTIPQLIFLLRVPFDFVKSSPARQ